jgi:hypothetical protein
MTRVLLLEALVLHAIVKVGLRLATCRRLQAFLESAPASFASQSAPLDIARAAQAMSRRTGGTTCLADALVVYTMLNRRRRAPRLRIGVRRDARQSIEGHAWVECDGAIVIGEVPGLAHYALLA